MLSTLKKGGKFYKDGNKVNLWKMRMHSKATHCFVVGYAAQHRLRLTHWVLTSMTTGRVLANSLTAFVV